MATELGFTGSDLYDPEVSVTLGHPNFSGMDHFAGHLFGGLDYYDWPKTVDGVTARTQVYATTDTANGAIAHLAGSEPFFVWVAFNAPHGPFHEPPHELLSDPSIYSWTVGHHKYRAMIEAMDTEFGRIMAAVDLTDTTVIFVADNGTPGGYLQPPYPITHGKATVYEGGLNVPLIIAGEAVSPTAQGTESAGLAQATDLFSTILEIAGVAPPPRKDSVSLLPYLDDPAMPSLREVVYSELFLPNGGPIDPERHDRAARGPRYKLVRNGFDAGELYDLAVDPYELSPISLGSLTPEQRAAYLPLEAAIQERRGILELSVPGLATAALGALAALLALAAVSAIERLQRSGARGS